MDITKPPASLRVALMLADQAGQLSGAALKGLWKAWTGEARFARALAQLEARGLVQRLQGGREVDARIYKLTEAGRAAAAGGRLPPERWARAWDGQWRMLSFDIPQSEASVRMRLRRRLLDVGFGAVQRSVWVTPDPVSDIVADMPEFAQRPGSLLLLEGRPAGGASDESLVSAAWDFTRINRAYDDYLKILAAHPPASGAASGITKTAWKKWLKTEAAGWQHAVAQDPLLPDALLPAGYRGKTAWARRLEALRALPDAD